MANPDALGPASISLGTATSSFISFLPSFAEVRRADPDDPGMAKDILLGEIAATAVAMGVALIVSHLSGSPVPVVASALMCLILAFCYNRARVVS